MDIDRVALYLSNQQLIYKTTVTDLEHGRAEKARYNNCLLLFHKSTKRFEEFIKTLTSHIVTMATIQH